MQNTFSLSRVSERNGLFDNRVVFALIALLSFLVAYVGDKVVFTESFYFSLFTKAHYSVPYFEEIRDYNVQIGWLFYVTAPILLAIKFLGVAGCIFAAAYMRDWNLPFKSVFRVVMLAESVMILESVVRFAWMGFVKHDISMAYYVCFSPLAAINVFDYESLAMKPWLIPLLKNASVFQLGYMVFLALGLKPLFNVSFFRSVGMVLSSYFVLLLLYVGSMAFFALIA